MKNNTIDNLAQEVLDSGIATSLSGCTDADIASIESEFAVQLPSTYKDFLHKMGKGAGELWTDCIYKYPDVIDFCRDMADEFLEKNSEYRLKDSDFVFLEHQGCQFYFFNTTEGGNPPVYRFGDNEPNPVKVANQLSEFFAIEFDTEIKSWLAYTESKRGLTT